jgi:hypothetical protein
MSCSVPYLRSTQAALHQGRDCAEPGATNLRGKIICDRVLLHARPESGKPRCCSYTALSVVYLQHIVEGRTGYVASRYELLQRNKDVAATCAHEEASIIARSA